MLLFYVDESGTLDPNCDPIGVDGQTAREYLYVLTAVSLFEKKWHGFEKTINRKKRELIDTIRRRTQIRLDLSDCEVKSTWVRIPKQRAKHPFLANLTAAELTEVCDRFYAQLDFHNMFIFTVIVDKRYLEDYMDQSKLHRKAWELLLERIEEFMRIHNPSHQALMICDDISIQANRSLAMKHAYLLENGTTRDLWLKHICEMPHFVRSELSNGVQLADLVGYNFYRAFRYEDAEYSHLHKVLGRLWSMPNDGAEPKGLFVFPSNSPLRDFRAIIATKKARLLAETSLKTEVRRGEPYQADVRHRTEPI